MVLEDGEIVRRCLSGQTGLMDLLIDRHATELYSLCVKLTRNRPDADDLFQDTWAKVMRSLDRYDPQRRFKAWLFAICTNRYRDLYRWHKRWSRRVTRLGRARDDEGPRRPGDDLMTMADDRADPAEEAAARESRRAVRAALDTLEDDLRVPMLLHYLQDFSVAEVAFVVGIPEGTVKTRLLRGREKLRTELVRTGHGR